MNTALREDEIVRAFSIRLFKSRVGGNYQCSIFIFVYRLLSSQTLSRYFPLRLFFTFMSLFYDSLRILLCNYPMDFNSELILCCCYAISPEYDLFGSIVSWHDRRYKCCFLTFPNKSLLALIYGRHALTRVVSYCWYL